MGEKDERHAADLVRRVSEHLHDDAALEQAVELLGERYQLTPEQAHDFLDGKAREDNRDAVEVAAEILKRRHEDPADADR